MSDVLLVLKMLLVFDAVFFLVLLGALMFDESSNE